MKGLPLIYIGIIVLIACKPSKNDDVMVIDKNISTNEYKIDTIKFLENMFPIFLSGNNYTFVSDSIIQLNYKFIAFRKLGKIDLTSHYCADDLNKFSYHKLGDLEIGTPLKTVIQKSYKLLLQDLQQDLNSML